MKQCVEPGDSSEGASMSAPGVKSSSSRDFLDFPTLFVNSVCLCKALPGWGKILTRIPSSYPWPSKSLTLVTRRKQLSYNLKTLVTEWGRQASVPEEGTFGLRQREGFPGKERKYFTGENGELQRERTLYPGKSLQGERCGMWLKMTSQQASVNAVPGLFQPVTWCALRSTGKIEIKNIGESPGRWRWTPASTEVWRV